MAIVWLLLLFLLGAMPQSKEDRKSQGSKRGVKRPTNDAQSTTKKQKTENVVTSLILRTAKFILERTQDLDTLSKDDIKGLLSSTIADIPWDILNKTEHKGLPVRELLLESLDEQVEELYSKYVHN